MFEKLLGAFASNFGTKLISLIIAVVLWIVVLGSRNVEVTKDVPLEVVTSSELIPANEVPEYVTFRLSGPKAFLRAIRDRREEPIRINLTQVKPGLVTYRFSSENIHVPIGVKVLMFHPAAILIKLESLKKRDVPVRLDLQGSLPEGYRIAHTEIRPALVKIKGPESRVDGVTEISTKPLDVSDFRQPIEKEVSLNISQQDIQIDGALPKAFIQVEPVSSNFRIKNIEIKVLAHENYSLSEKTVSVFVRANHQDLKSLDRSQISAVVDLRGKGKGRYLEKVKITLPPQVGLGKIVPDKVQVDLY